MGDIPIDWHDVLPSTNAEAMRLAATDIALPRWIVARRQTAGRGRSGRAWIAADDHLACSLVFETQVPLQRLAELSFVAGLCLHDAVMAIAPKASTAEPLADRVLLKWPNDLMIDGAKTAGILVETTHAAGRQIAVVGIGVNIAGPPQVAARPTTSLSAAGITTTPDRLLDRLNAAFATRLPDWSASGGFADIRADWLARGPHLGAEIAVHADGTHVSGLFAGLDGDGALLLADETTTAPRRFTFGDVALLRHR